MAQLPPFPTRDAVVDPTRMLSRVWGYWLTAVRDLLSVAAARVASVRLTAQAAAITTTAALAVVTTGLYRVSSVLRITQAATSSSSATVTIGWTDTGVALTQAFAAVTGNTVTTTQSSSVVIAADALTSVTYAVAYANVGATPMQFSVSVLVEEVG